MSSEGNATASSPSSSPVTTATATASPSGKRSRDPEDEVYVDNLHSHKRYLSEIMASSLNGLTVGDLPSENLMVSPARSESMLYLRDEMSLQYSPMSEDSEDSRFYENSTHTCSSQPESVPTSPVSPYRCQKALNGFVSGGSGPPTTSYPSHGGLVSSMSSSHPRQRGSDTEGRFPSSPSDICHSADLRRAALLRSVQMRTQPLGSSQFEWHFSAGQESGSNMETEDRLCSSYMKAVVNEREYQIAECEPLRETEGEDGEKSCGKLVDLKGDESSGD
ncbi:hypothetical protein ACJIZ3_016584 [Penstemon smallii]|uniref:Uncharacterized protein n=1 Tax=Penstemon smallii TaxID=265156 RepID=A0ABD3SU92_9LAMI